MVILALAAGLIPVGGRMIVVGFSGFMFHEPICQGDDGQDSYQAEKVPIAVVDYFGYWGVSHNGKKLAVVVPDD